MTIFQCPKSIPKGRWRTLWSACAEELGDGTVSDARLLERMVLHLMSAHSALNSAQEEPFVSGSKGQTVEHPGFKVAARADALALSLARQLRLTPLVRSHGNEGATEEEEGSDDDPIAAARDELAQRRAAKAG